MSKQNRFLPAVWLPLAGLLLLVAAGGVDYALRRLLLHYRGMFTMEEVYLVLGAGTVGVLLQGVLLVAVTWLALRRWTSSRLSAVLLSLLGLAAAFAPLLWGLFISRSLPLALVPAAGAHLQLTGAVLAALGLLLVLRPGPQARQPEALAAG